MVQPKLTIPDTLGPLKLDASGRIIDYLNPQISRANNPEELVRQYYARVLVEEYGYPKSWMVFEAPVSIGSETKSADIVIFQSASAAAGKKQGEILMIVETKAPTKTKGEAQLVSYVSASSASGGIWTNGDAVAYFRRFETPTLHLVEWTNIPRKGEAWDSVGHYTKSHLQPPRDLKRVFQRCHNAIYTAGLDSEDIAIDMVRIILAKYRDEQNAGDQCQFRCTPEEFANANGRKAVAERVHSLFEQVKADHPDVFPKGEQISIGADNLATVVNELQPFRFVADEEVEQVYDVIGTAFEVYVAAHLKGNRGQYFTNRLVVQMMVEMLDPTEFDTVLDPACGPGGFLIAAQRHIRHRILQSARSHAAMVKEIKSVEKRLYGIDISPKLVRVAKTNMILNGDGHGGIVHGNSLRRLSELPAGYPLRPDSYVLQQPTKILTNPPFGASHELRERSADVLANFSLGRIWEEGSNGWWHPTESLSENEGVPPEILFLERCIDLLSPGGRLGIVIARGILDNRDALPARQFILRNTRLLGVVNCHPNTFAPFNGAKACILFLEKKGNAGFEEGEDYPVFMAISLKVGQDSQGREILRVDPTGETVLVDGQPVVDHDLGDITQAWRLFLSARPIAYESAWSIPLSRVVSSQEMRFNPTRYAPEVEKAAALVMELSDTDQWYVERLGDIATVFNGPRFKRPFAEAGVASGPGVVRMYTPKAFFEERGESAKYLDRNRASRTQLRQLDVLTLRKDYILIVDSGTAGKLLGRVGMTTSVHDGSIGNNNMIRVVIDEGPIRDYVYQFLRSDLGQALLLRNVYGTNQDHIEPDDVKDMPIPIPRDESRLMAIHRTVRDVIEMREQAAERDREAAAALSEAFHDVLDQEGIDMRGD